jgi:hypothetical protein
MKRELYQKKILFKNNIFRDIHSHNKKINLNRIFILLLLHNNSSNIYSIYYLNVQTNYIKNFFDIINPIIRRSKSVYSLVFLHSIPSKLNKMVTILSYRLFYFKIAMNILT